MNSADLVELLRSPLAISGEHRDLAADRLEALEVRLAEAMERESELMTLAHMDGAYRSKAEIARLQEQVETLTRKNERLENTLKLHNGDTMSLNNEVELFRSHWNDAEARALAAEAERDRLREALTRIADGGRGSISAAEKNHIAFAALQKEPQP